MMQVLVTATGLEPTITYFVNEHMVEWNEHKNYSVFIYKLSGCGFESRCSRLIFRYCACFEQEVP